MPLNVGELYIEFLYIIVGLPGKKKKKRLCFVDVTQSGAALSGNLCGIEVRRSAIAQTTLLIE